MSGRGIDIPSVLANLPLIAIGAQKWSRISMRRNSLSPNV